MVKNPPASAGDAVQSGSVLGYGRSPGGANGQLTPVLLLGKSHRQRSLVGLSPWVVKSRTQLNTHTHTHTHISIIYKIKKNVSFNFPQIMTTTWTFSNP